MKRLLILAILFPQLLCGQLSPTASLPYLQVRQARIATTNVADLSSTENANINIQYIDGTGRAMQTVKYGASPEGKDIIAGFSTLDEFGRLDKSYLPAPAALASGGYQSNLPSLSSSFYGDANPYSQVTQYQNAPQSMPLVSVGAGQAFRSGTTKTTTQSYKTAGAGIRKYSSALAATSATVSGSFSNGDLIKTVITDEDGNQIIEYKDGVSGLLYESHQKDKNSSTLLVTTYIYDQLARLKYVLPPKVSSALASTSGTLFNESSSLFLDGIYAIHYNSWGLPSETHKPGGGWTYTIYNELEQPVMSQDARLRVNNLWLWEKKDGHGRTVMSGTLTKSGSLATIQNAFFNSGAVQQFEERSTGSGNLYGYTNAAFPSGYNPAAGDVKSVYYYDDYSWVGNAALNFSYYKTAQWTNAKGLATGSMVRRLDTGVFLKSVSYYDDKNRVIQTKTENRFGGINQTDVVYNFPGEVMEERTIYRKPGQTDLEVKTVYERDHQGRVIGAVHYLNGIATPLAQYVYDEIGRLKQKNLMASAHDIITENSPQPNGDQDLANRYVLLEPGTISAANGTYLACVLPGALQKIDYSYDIRGNLRGINTDATDNISLQDGDVFGLKLDHFETAQTYNGKVAKQSWQTTSGARSYTYGYDGYDRLSAATYSGQGAENYSVSGIGYDSNGNITGLNRNGYTGSSWGQIDNLSYTYTNASYGNQLQGVRDYANTTIGQKDNGSSSDYTYWPDGSLKSDANKGITQIDYNYLGLPEKIFWGSSVRIENSYDAEGLLLYRKFVNGGTTVQTDYMGGLIYQDGILESILHDEGRIKVDYGSLANLHYQFFITDHLGNTRAIVERVSSTTALVQETHYYPFGAVMEGVGIDGGWDKQLYQGNELIGFNRYNSYDFNLRQYDPWQGRFTSLDPVDIYSVSGYSGMMNNPVYYTDPNGDCPICLIYAGAAIIGGANNLISNWSKVKDWKTGLAYFGSGAVGGVVSVTPAGLLGGAATTATLNVGIDIATGNVPKLDNGWDYAKYGLKLGLDGLGAGSGGGISKWAFNGGFKNLFGWFQSPYFNPTPGWAAVENPATGVLEKVSWAAETGVTATKVPITNFASNAAKTGLSLADDVGNGSYSVYQGFDRATNAVKYVGITAREATVRFGEHYSAFGTGKELLDYRVLEGATNLTKSQARILEQGIINQYGLVGQEGGQLLNKINSIAPKNWLKFGIR